MAIGGRPDAVHQDIATQRAVDLAMKFIKGLHSVNDSDFEGLRAYFSPTEIYRMLRVLAIFDESKGEWCKMNVSEDLEIYEVYLHAYFNTIKGERPRTTRLTQFYELAEVCSEIAKKVEK